MKAEVTKCVALAVLAGDGRIYEVESEWHRHFILVPGVRSVRRRVFNSLFHDLCIYAVTGEKTFGAHRVWKITGRGKDKAEKNAVKLPGSLL